MVARFAEAERAHALLLDALPEILDVRSRDCVVLLAGDGPLLDPESRARWRRAG